MPLRRRRSYCQQHTEYERFRLVGLRVGRYSFHTIAEILGRNVSILHDCWEQRSKVGSVYKRPCTEWSRCMPYSAYDCGESYFVTCRISNCIWYHSNTTSCQNSVNLRSTLTQEPCIFHWLKSLPFATPVMSRRAH